MNILFIFFIFICASMTINFYLRAYPLIVFEKQYRSLKKIFHWNQVFGLSGIILFAVFYTAEAMDSILIFLLLFLFEVMVEVVTFLLACIHKYPTGDFSCLLFFVFMFLGLDFQDFSFNTAFAGIIGIIIGYVLVRYFIRNYNLKFSQ